jgi:hypothetical protein
VHSTAELLAFFVAAAAMSRLAWNRGKIIILLLTALVLSGWLRDRAQAFFQLERPTAAFAPASTVQDGAQYGAPILGKILQPTTGCLAPWQFAAECGAVKTALDRVLTPHERFLDLTASALYGVAAGRPLVAKYVAYVNYFGDAPQLATRKILRQNQIKVALLANALAFDHSPLPLRTYYLYRYALLANDVLPWRITPTKTLLMPRDYFVRAGIPVPNATQKWQALDAQFPPLNLAWLPWVWARGNFNLQAEVAVAAPAPAAHWQSTLNFPGGRNGADAGLLELDLDTGGAAFPVLAQWQSEFADPEARAASQMVFFVKTGKVLVPLDASPRWLLAKKITALTLTGFNPQTQQRIPLKIISARLCRRP